MLIKNPNVAAIVSAQFGMWLVSHLWGNMRCRTMLFCQTNQLSSLLMTARQIIRHLAARDQLMCTWSQMLITNHALYLRVVEFACCRTDMVGFNPHVVISLRALQTVLQCSRGSTRVSHGQRRRSANFCDNERPCSSLCCTILRQIWQSLHQRTLPASVTT